MNKLEHFLTCVTEECAEIAHHTCKALRFGLSDRYPEKEVTNAQEILAEFYDLSAVIEILIDEGELPKYSDNHIRMRIEDKKNKIYFWMEHAKKRRALTE